LRHVKAKLQLENVNVIQTRVESYQDEAGFSNIVCRAFSSLRDFYEKTRHLVNEQGILLAMKAQIDETELEEVRPLLKTLEKIDLEKVGDEKKRCLIRMAIH
jgi:16S rRNA (guanine527-N7)-methyltransferase